MTVVRGIEETKETGPKGYWIGRLISTAALTAAGLLTIWGMSRTATLGLFVNVFPSSPSISYEDEVGRAVGQRTSLALLLVVLGAALPLLTRLLGSGVDSQTGSTAPASGCKAKGRLLLTTAQTGLAVAAIAITLNAVADIQPMLTPFADEVADLNRFPSPAGWRGTGATGTFATHPGASRYWAVNTAPLSEACVQLEASLDQWADQGSVAPKTTRQPLRACSFIATKGSSDVEARVSLVDTGDTPMSAHVIVTSKREVRPKDLK